jgi:uncharacterized protein DUF1122
VVIAGPDGSQADVALWCEGRPAAGLRPWADLVVEDPSVLGDVAAALGPGASVMVAYEGDATEQALRRKVPPAATPLGLVLRAAGCRWFKDWCFPEGGRGAGRSSRERCRWTTGVAAAPRLSSWPISVRSSNVPAPKATTVAAHATPLRR